MTPGRARFETALQVRPDDIDMNRHVHASRYFDYVLAARYDQMERCYGMSMEAFLARGFGWVIRATRMEFKRPLGLGDRFVVATWIEEFLRHSVRVQFLIRRQDNGKLACDGEFLYTMVNLKTGRAVPLPDDIVARYAI
jgi:acyl-CoA thioester hydrolase/thioesterase-3